MRELVRDSGRIEHMLEAIKNVDEFISGLTYDEVAGNKILSHAIVHNVQVLGEAAYKLSKEFCKAHPEINWRDIIGLRHVLVHDYYRIDMSELWYIAKEELPPLQRQIENLLTKINT